MGRIFLIGLAGALGTLLRYGIGVWAARAWGSTFPFGTLLVNVLGCFVIGTVAHLAASSRIISPLLRLTLATGFCGGLTTYSSFDLETTQLLRHGALATGFTNVAVTLGGCFLAGLAGIVTATWAADRAERGQAPVAGAGQVDPSADAPELLDGPKNWVREEQGEP